MSTCQPCGTADHDPAGCDNRDTPMIMRTCGCNCDRTLTLKQGYLAETSALDHEPDT